MKRRLYLFLPLLFFVVGVVSAQTQVRGTVVDDLGEAVIGATVVVKDRPTVGTSTDVNGVFTLNNLRNTDKFLVISYIGMKTQEVEIRDNMEIELEQDALMLDEVITVAFGTTTKSSFTGSAKVISSEEISKRPVTNIMETLSGKVTGLQTTMPSGQPGSAPSLVIRGQGSISMTSSPLYIVDGFPYSGSINSLNPADIKDIVVLKDATSAALYGSRGANGVIIINTKSAKKGTTRINVEAKLSAANRGRIDYDFITSPSAYYEAHYQSLYNYLTNPKEGNGLSPEEAYIKANTDMIGDKKELGGLAYNVYSYPDNEYLIGIDGKINPNATLGRVMGDNYLIPDDWREDIFNTSLRQEYNLSASSSNDQTDFYASFGYLKEDGTVEVSGFERYAARLKASTKLKDWFTLRGNIAYTRRITNTLSEPPFSQALYTAPIYPLYLRDKDGNIIQDKNGPIYDFGAVAEGSPVDRPVYTNQASFQSSKLNTNKSEGDILNASGGADFTFLDGFKFTLNAGTVVQGNRQTVTRNPFYGYGKEMDGMVYKYHTRMRTFNMQQLLNYSSGFGLHNIAVTLGHEHDNYNYVYLFAQKTGMFSYFENQELDGAIIASQNMGSNETNSNVEGFFGRVLYDYDNKYFLSASLRRDGSSKFHPDNRWGTFYSAGGAYIMSNEDWLNIDWLDFLKVKAAIGQMGNDNVANYRYIDTYNILNVNDELSLSFATKGNKDITWETNSNFNAGVEFELFKGIIKGGTEFYNKKTTDMLYWFNVPPSLGYNGYYANIGDMYNRGFELDLSFNPIRTKKIDWSINLNLSTLKSKVTYIPTERKTETLSEYQGKSYEGYTDGNRYWGEGLPYNTWSMKKYAGVSESGKAQWYLKEPDPITGETTTEVWANADNFVSGDPNPDLFGGFGTLLAVYDFDLSIIFNYSIGGLGYDGGYASLMGVPNTNSVGSAIHIDYAKSWSADNPNSDIPRWQFNDRNGNSTSDRFLIDASYLSLQNIQIGYTLPRRISKKMGISNLRVYISCDGVYYWTKRKGFDPRFSISGGSAQTAYSPNRVFTGGINLEF